jgi:hypothetical protein
MTGFADKVNRGVWTMQPAHLVCEKCGGRGWVDPSSSVKIESRNPDTGAPLNTDNWLYRRFMRKR